MTARDVNDKADDLSLRLELIISTVRMQESVFEKYCQHEDGEDKDLFSGMATLCRRHADDLDAIAKEIPKLTDEALKVGLP